MMQYIKLYETQVAITAAILFICLVIYRLGRYVVVSFGKKHNIRHSRQLKLSRFIYYSALLLAAISVVTVWGIKLTSIWVLTTSVAGFLGVAMFASWSLLSSILAAFVLFFTTPFRIGDSVSFRDNDVTVSGTVVDMTLFYVFIETEDRSRVAVPNNIILQKAVTIRPPT